MKRDRILRQLLYCLLSIMLFIPCAYAYDTMSNPEWYIDMWDGGYSDWMICPQGHEQLSGEWAAAIMYDGIATAEAMWFEKYWVCPSWTSNSQFSVIQPFTAWDDPTNPIVGYNDAGQSVINNGDVEITIGCSMVDGYTVMGLAPGVETPNRVTSYRYVMLQTYTIRNVKTEDIANLSLFQMIHPQPNDDYGPNNYGVYDPTDYSDPHDNFTEFRYDMTFFAPYANWSPNLDDVIGFSASVQPTAYEIGTFPGHGSEPGAGSLHHEVEADNLKGVNYLGPEEIAGAMKWYLGTVKAGEEVSLTVLLSTSHSDMGLPPEPVPEPTVIEYTGDTQGYRGEQVTLSAQLTDQNGNPLPDKVINFLVGNQGAEAITDESGIATTLLLVDQLPGNYMVTASFIGDNEYGGSLDSQPFEVLGAQICEIDIKPCSWPNAVNPGDKGVIPVAIQTTSVAAGESIDFDATTVDPLSVEFGPAGATARHGRGHIEDWDEDGDLDMVLHFLTQETGIAAGDTIACLTGATLVGQGIRGCDAVVTVPHNPPQTGGTFGVAAVFSLDQNWPNPFSVGTRIAYSLPKNTHVLLQVYDATGKLVKSIMSEKKSAGTHFVYWNGKDASGMEVPSGTYFCRMTTGEQTSVKKMILLR